MGSRRTGAEQIYAAAQAWVERGLLADDSLFTPGKAIWTPDRLADLRARFPYRKDGVTDDFFDKLKFRLDGSPQETYQLMSEAMFVHLLIAVPDAMTFDGKVQRINRVLDWSPPRVVIPENLLGALSSGIVNPKIPQFLYWHRLGFIIEMAENLKEKKNGERNLLLGDPWQFKSFAEAIYFRGDSMSVDKVRTQRNAVYHLVFPDTFEGIISNRDKNFIADAFYRCVNDSDEDVDLRLQQIRPVLEAKYAARYDHTLHLYEDEIRIQWNPKLEGYTGPTICADDLHNADQSKGAETGIDFASLSTSLYLDAPFLREINTLLHDKRQVIFQGPPGTGKTYVARALAWRLAGESDDRVTLVQFHPSYAYEDFVQGYRPTLIDGQPGFELRDGPLLRAARRAQDEPDAAHFLVIDEINRGNLAKVFGELYFLLEYRDESIQLQYDAEKSFSLPKNLYIMGTMNTADRSIALVDLALRRRFHFAEFHPDQPPIAGLLRRYLDANAPAMGWVADVVDRANELLRDDRHAAVGPSHFMRPGLDAAAVRRIWQYSVLPYIEERLFGDPNGRLAEFDLDKLRGVSEFDTPDLIDADDADGASPTADA